MTSPRTVVPRPPALSPNDDARVRRAPRARLSSRHVRARAARGARAATSRPSTSCAWHRGACAPRSSSSSPSCRRRSSGRRRRGSAGSAAASAPCATSTCSSLAIAARSRRLPDDGARAALGRARARARRAARRGPGRAAAACSTPRGAGASSRGSGSSSAVATGSVGPVAAGRRRGRPAPAAASARCSARCAISTRTRRRRDASAARAREAPALRGRDVRSARRRRDAPGPLVRSLMRLQDALGEHQDAVTQVAWLRAYADSAQLPPATLLAMGAVVDRLERRAAQAARPRSRDRRGERFDRRARDAACSWTRARNVGRNGRPASTRAEDGSMTLYVVRHAIAEETQLRRRRRARRLTVRGAAEDARRWCAACAGSASSPTSSSPARSCGPGRRRTSWSPALRERRSRAMLDGARVGRRRRRHAEGAAPVRPQAARDDRRTRAQPEQRAGAPADRNLGRCGDRSEEGWPAPRSR